MVLTGESGTSFFQLKLPTQIEGTLPENFWTIPNTADNRYQARLFSRVWLESKGLVSAIPERLQKQYIVLP